MTSAAPVERSLNLADLLNSIAQGDRMALALLYQRTSAHLLGVILRIHDGDRTLAETVLQDVYIQVWRSAGRYDARRDQPLTWLMSIARLHAIEMLRLRPGMSAASTESDNFSSSALSDTPPAELVCAALLARASRRFMNALSPLEQQSFALAFYQGHSYAEISNQLGFSLNTVKAGVRRALAALCGGQPAGVTGSARSGTPDR